MPSGYPWRGCEWARNSPPSLVMIGNNYLKQLAFGARANSPVPVCRLWNGFPSEARISRLSVTICRRQKKRGRVSPRTYLKVVFASCSGCFQSQNAWVRNAPDVLWQYFVMPSRQWDGSEISVLVDPRAGPKHENVIFRQDVATELPVLISFLPVK